MKFIDLFAGIGGFRLGMEKAGFTCVFSAEIDQHASEMYIENYNENPKCDITKLDARSIPDFDVLCAGFPCQAFSISGKQKGFYDETRGTLFFDICRILEEKKPRAFILENVKNLTTHDKGRTFAVMTSALSKLGYSVQYKVLNARDFGVPQNRERIVLVGNREGKTFDFGNIIEHPVTSMRPFLDKTDTSTFEYLDKSEYTLIDSKYIKRQEKSGLIFVGYRNKKTRSAGTRPNTEHLSRVHKQPNRIYSVDGIHPTLPSQESSGRFYIYDGVSVRKLTLDECFRFMGFPEDFHKIGNKSQLYNRIGNSICVNMVASVATELHHMLESKDNDMDKNPDVMLEFLYHKAEILDDTFVQNFNSEQLKNIETIVQKESTNKGVYTALVTSLLYKTMHPEQDVRNHKVDMPGGYSGRSFDTKYVTPFLKKKQFLGAMKESGWLTRSIEQDHPFTLEFPGKITPITTKNAFLNILQDVEENSFSPEAYLVLIFNKSIKSKLANTVIINNPVTRENSLNIEQIINLLSAHFGYKYSIRSSSILPVIAFYSIYECLIEEVSRYEGKILDPLSSHYSSDRSSGNAGDIVIRDDNHNLYEVIEIKYGIEINELIVSDAIKKIMPNDKLQRYYILSTIEPSSDDRNKFSAYSSDLKINHGCELIINGLIKTLNYYLRLINNTDKFLDNYVKNLGQHPEIQNEQKIIFNKLIAEM